MGGLGGSLPSPPITAAESAAGEELAGAQRRHPPHPRSSHPHDLGGPGVHRWNPLSVAGRPACPWQFVHFIWWRQRVPTGLSPQPCQPAE